MPVGAPEGNNNASKGKPWRDAINWALENHKDSQTDKAAALRAIAMQLIDRAKDGDLAAMKELGDRIEGKAAQSVQLSGHLSTSEMTTEELIEHYKTLLKP